MKRILLMLAIACPAMALGSTSEAEVSGLEVQTAAASDNTDTVHSEGSTGIESNDDSGLVHDEEHEVIQPDTKFAFDNSHEGHDSAADVDASASGDVSVGPRPEIDLNEISRGPTLSRATGRTVTDNLVASNFRSLSRSKSASDTRSQEHSVVSNGSGCRRASFSAMGTINVDMLPEEAKDVLLLALGETPTKAPLHQGGVDFAPQEANSSSSNQSEKLSDLQLSVPPVVQGMGTDKKVALVAVAAVFAYLGRKIWLPTYEKIKQLIGIEKQTYQVRDGSAEQLPQLL